MSIIVVIGLSAITILATAFALVRWRRYHAHDALIEATAARHGLRPGLIWTVIRRESGFNVRCEGKAGELGLMQVTEAAAREWAQAEGLAGFQRLDLFDPGTNIVAGTWYLARAIGRWSEKRDPLPYALAEYNAGLSNVRRWAKDDDGYTSDFLRAITYPSTRQYVEDILLGYRGHL
ncbi:MAG: lytic transglycosylase domain-containing protein [Kiritimatiellae bacterium]|nr:lytic transglycosylase domain-containing protein [Kiritimatiellia bacterium]